MAAVDTAEDSISEIRLDEDGLVTMRFRLIPAGEFLMGSRGYSLDEEPIHRVVISEPFRMGETPVTQAQFAVWTASADYERWFAENKDKLDEGAGPHRNYFTGGDPAVLPAEQLSWHEAGGYCEWLTSRLPVEQWAGLPTEALWEYACRGGTDTDYWSGDGEAALAEVGWYQENSSQQTHPVKAKNRPNFFGLYDLHGNVWEWCRDVFDPEAYLPRPDGVPDPVATSGTVEVPQIYRDIFRVFGRIGGGDTQVPPEDAGVLDRIVEVFGKNETWKADIEAIEVCKKSGGRWPADRVSLAVETAGFIGNQIKGLENSEDPPRVLRGGSWFSSASGCRSAFRSGGRAGNRGGDYGFRVCLFPGPADSQSDA